jgi:hypothetical protein
VFALAELFAPGQIALGSTTRAGLCGVLLVHTYYKLSGWFLFCNPVLLAYIILFVSGCCFKPDGAAFGRETQRWKFVNAVMMQIAVGIRAQLVLALKRITCG